MCIGSHSPVLPHMQLMTALLPKAARALSSRLAW
jgi:hypothetical protein